MRALQRLAFVLAVGVVSAAQPTAAQGTAMAVTQLDYDYGDAALTLPGLPANSPVEMRGRLFYPTAAVATNGALPVVVLLHGRHATCQNNLGGVFLRWPCGPGQTAIPSHLGYDYFAEDLASHGMIVISISANGINARDNLAPDLGALARAQLIQEHLGLLERANRADVAPFGTALAGLVDLSRVGTMGHSRGGEGVVRHYLYNQSLGSPYGVQAVLPLAPINANGLVPAGVPLMVTVGYCDGDVMTLEGAAFYDRARYAVPMDTAPKHLVVAYGANHNFFNTVWSPGTYGPGASDDWQYVDNVAGTDPYCSAGVGSDARLSETEQQDLLDEAGTAFFTRYLLHDVTLNTLRGDAPLTGGRLGAPVRITYQPPANAADSKLLHTFDMVSDPGTNNLGTAFSTSITTAAVCGGTGARFSQRCEGSQPSVFSLNGVEPNNEAVTMRLRFAAGDVAMEMIPATDTDWSPYAALSFRASMDISSTDATTMDGELAIRDQDGNIATVVLGQVTDALDRPPGDTDGVLPRVILNGIRIPLTAFAGVDLTRIDRLWFAFQGSGAILLTDLMVTK